MSDDKAKAVVRRFIDEVLNRRNLAMAGAIIDGRALDQLKSSLNLYLVLSAFPDFRLTIEHMIAEGERVTVLSTFGGTHRAEFMGVPPTGRGVSGRMAHAFRVVDGRIVEASQTFDPWGLVQQLGVQGSAELTPAHS